MRALVPFLIVGVVLRIGFRERPTSRLAEGRCGLWQKARSFGRRASLRFSAHRSFRDARWRHYQDQPWRLAVGSPLSPRMAAPWLWAISSCSNPKSIPSWRN